MRKTEVLGIPISDLTIRESMKKVDSFFKAGKVSTISIITMKGLLLAQDDESIQEFLRNMDLTIPADVEILRAGKIAYYNRIRDVENKVFAIEFFKKLIRQKKTVYLLSDNVANLEKLKGELLSYEENLKIIGGFSFDSTENGDDFAVNEINMAFADVLISNLESPRREEFMAQNHMKLNMSIWLMVRADANLTGAEKGLFVKVHDYIVKKLFSIRLNKYNEENEKEDSDADLEKEKVSSEKTE